MDYKLIVSAVLFHYRTLVYSPNTSLLLDPVRAVFKASLNTLKLLQVNPFVRCTFNS